MEINERIRTLRKTLKLNQQAFGDSLRISNTAVSKIETGENKLTEQNIASICKQYNVNESWLRTGEGEMFITLSKDEELAVWSGTVISPDSDGTFMKRFVHVLSRLTQDEWKVLEHIAQMMGEENEKAEQ